MPAYELRRGGFRGFVGGHGAGSNGLVPPPPDPHRPAPNRGQSAYAKQRIAEHQLSTTELESQIRDERMRMHNYLKSEIEGGRAYGASDEVVAHGANFQIL